MVGNQGDLYGNAMTWFDHETGSVWSQPLGAAILGPLSGTELELLPSQLTTWGTWRSSHPGTSALAAQVRRSGFALDQMLIAVEIDREALAVPVPDLRRAGVVEATVGEVPIALTMVGDSWMVFALRHDGRTLRLFRGEVDDLVDGEGGRWDQATGRSLAGGEALGRIPAITVFPGDYRTFWPEGRVLIP